MEMADISGKRCPPPSPGDTGEVVDPTHTPWRWPGGVTPGGADPLLHMELGLGYQGMSSLWTPGGEHRPERPERDPGGAGGAAEELSEEERQQLEQHLAEARRQLLATPARTVVANHAIGLFQLATLHLGEEHPRLDEARLAIDAMAALVEGLKGRLGPDEEPLGEALHQARLAFVEVSRRQAPEGGSEGDPAG